MQNKSKLYILELYLSYICHCEKPRFCGNLPLPKSYNKGRFPQSRCSFGMTIFSNNTKIYNSEINISTANKFGFGHESDLIFQH